MNQGNDMSHAVKLSTKQWGLLRDMEDQPLSVFSPRLRLNARAVTSCERLGLITFNEGCNWFEITTLGRDALARNGK